MAKLTTSDLTTLTNETSAVNTINSNMALIETAIENTLSRDGTSPNSMSSSLDMNSNRILNLPQATASTEPITLAQALSVFSSGTVTLTIDYDYFDPAATAYGATGNGVADDGVEINLCIVAASAAASTGAPSVVNLRGRTYATSIPILVKNNVKLINGRIKALAGTWTTTNAVVEVESSVSNVWMNNLRVDGNSLAGNCFRNESTNNINFEDCWAEHYTVAGYSLAGACQNRFCKALQWLTTDAEVEDYNERTAIGFSVEAVDVHITNPVAAYNLYNIYVAAGIHHIQIISPHLYNGIPGGTGAASWFPVNLYLDACYLVTVVGMYLDNGRVVATKPSGRNYQFILSDVITLYDNTKCTLQEWIELVTTTASTEGGDIKISGNWTQSLPLFGFTASGAGTFVVDTTEWAALLKDVFLTEDTLTVANGSNTSRVATFLSGHATGRSLVQFRSPTTSDANATEFGCEGNDPIIRSSGAQRFRIDDTNGIAYVGATAVNSTRVLLGATGWRVVSTGQALTHTGNTTKTAVATVSIPAGNLGPNGTMRVSTFWGGTSSANIKTYSVEFGGTAIFTTAPTTNSYVRDVREVHNMNSEAAQEFVIATTGGFSSTSTGASSTIDTSAAVDLVFYVTLANSGETAGLRYYVVEINYGA